MRNNTTDKREKSRQSGFHTFEIGDLAYARNFQTTGRWSSGMVIGERGKVIIYETMVGNEKWIKHANHLRPRRGNTQKTQEPTTLGWDMLLNTSGLENGTDRQRGTQPVPRALYDSSCRPTRRKRQPPWLQVDLGV